MNKVGNVFAKTYRAIDKYTSPRPGTGGNYNSHQQFHYAPALFKAGIAGFYFLSWPGIACGAASAGAALFTEQKTGSTWKGILAGAIAGAGLMAATAALTFASGGVGIWAFRGALMGSLQVLAGNCSANVRDASTTAILMGSNIMPGPLKLLGGVASGIAERYQSKSSLGKLLVGGEIGAAMGAAVRTAGLMKGPYWIPIAASAAAGAFGPFVGPRFTQLVRNLSEDLGKGVGWIKKKVTGKEWTPITKRMVGAVPLSFSKECFNAYMVSDFKLTTMFAGASSKIAQQAYQFFATRHDNCHEQPKNQSSEHDSLHKPHENKCSESPYKAETAKR